MVKPKKKMAGAVSMFGGMDPSSVLKKRPIQSPPEDVPDMPPSQPIIRPSKSIYN